MKSPGLHVGIASQRLVQRLGRRQALDVQFTESAIEPSRCARGLSSWTINLPSRLS